MSRLEFPNANILTNSAKITLTGAAPEILNGSSNTNALLNLADNSGSALLSLQSGQALSLARNLTNNGTVLIGASSTLGAAGSYTQAGGTTTVDGVLTAPSGVRYISTAGVVYAVPLRVVENIKGFRAKLYGF